MQNPDAKTAVHKPEQLSLTGQWIYALGQLGWSTLINIISLQLVYFYLPPDNAGIPIFITQVVFLGILNTITLVAASGRFVDAVSDPWIANLSDRHSGTLGRRIPFMRAGAIPAAFFCVMMFMPPVAAESSWNVIWLMVTQVLFYLSLTVYLAPYFALLPELGHTAETRLNLATWISATYALGIILASQVPALANMINAAFPEMNKVAALQFALAAIAAIALLLMLIPAFVIDERRYCASGGQAPSLKQALRHTFANGNFRYYVIAEFAYFMGLTIVMTGLLYYVTVLLLLEDGHMGVLLPLMLLTSFLFYPLVNIFARKWGKKPLVTKAFLIMAVFFFAVPFLGLYPLSSEVQGYLIVLMFAVPIAFLSVLPNAVLADIAEHDAVISGIRQEGMFFAARALMQKFGQTSGVFVFAALTSLGKNPGDDLGIRLSGLAGALLCLVAGIYFMGYQEKRLLRELEENESI